ncbi:hypothetical protein Tco_1330536 [Tanacetum coccineum]
MNYTVAVAKVVLSSHQECKPALKKLATAVAKSGKKVFVSSKENIQDDGGSEENERVEQESPEVLDNESPTSASPFIADSARVHTSPSNLRKRSCQQTLPIISAVEEATFLQGANVNTIKNTSLIHNEVTTSVFSTTDAVIVRLLHEVLQLPKQST